MRTATFPLIALLLAAPSFGQPMTQTDTARVYQEVDRKNPIAAGVLGAVFPGGGHFYAGEPVRGGVSLGVGVVVTALQWRAARKCVFLDDRPRGKLLCEMQGVYLTAGIFNMLMSIFDGSEAARRHNERLGVARKRVDVTAVATAHQAGVSVHISL